MSVSRFVLSGIAALALLVVACKRGEPSVDAGPTPLEMARPIPQPAATREVDVLFSRTRVDARPVRVEEAILRVRDDARFALARVVRTNDQPTWMLSKVADRPGYRAAVLFDHAPTLDEARAFLAGCDWLDPMPDGMQIVEDDDAGWKRVYGAALPRPR